MRIRALALLIPLALTVGASAAPTGPGVVILRAGSAILEDGTISPATVRVEGEWITFVGADSEVPAGALLVERPDAVLAPGFVDAHAWLDRRAALAEGRRASTPGFRAADAGRPGGEALAAAREAGVTLLGLAPSDANVVGGRPALVLGNGAFLRETNGLKIALGGAALDAERFPSSHWGALDLLGGEPAIREAEEARIPVLVRADGTDDIAAVLALHERRPGLRLLVVGGRAAAERADDLAAAGAAVVWGPASLSMTDRELSAPARLAAAGVPLAFASDDRPGSLRRTAVMAHRAGLSRQATLRALTAGAADLLDVGETTGRIRERRRADLVLWSGDPLDLSSRPVLTLVGGVTAGEEDR